MDTLTAGSPRTALRTGFWVRCCLAFAICGRRSHGTRPHACSCTNSLHLLHVLCAWLFLRTTLPGFITPGYSGSGWTPFAAFSCLFQFLHKLVFAFAALPLFARLWVYFRLHKFGAGHLVAVEQFAHTSHCFTMPHTNFPAYAGQFHCCGACWTSFHCYCVLPSAGTLTRLILRTPLHYRGTYGLLSGSFCDCHFRFFSSLATRVPLRTLGSPLVRFLCRTPHHWFTPWFASTLPLILDCSCRTSLRFNRTAGSLTAHRSAAHHFGRTGPVAAYHYACGPPPFHAKLHVYSFAPHQFAWLLSFRHAPLPVHLIYAPSYVSRNATTHGPTHTFMGLLHHCHHLRFYTAAYGFISPHIHGLCGSRDHLVTPGPLSTYAAHLRTTTARVSARSWVRFHCRLRSGLHRALWIRTLRPCLDGTPLTFGHAVPRSAVSPHHGLDRGCTPGLTNRLPAAFCAHAVLTSHRIV